jgi:hypothetical protein
MLLKSVFGVQLKCTSEAVKQAQQTFVGLWQQFNSELLDSIRKETITTTQLNCKLHYVLGPIGGYSFGADLGKDMSHTPDAYSSTQNTSSI